MTAKPDLTPPPGPPPSALAPRRSGFRLAGVSLVLLLAAAAVGVWLLLPGLLVRSGSVPAALTPQSGPETKSSGSRASAEPVVPAPAVPDSEQPASGGQSASGRDKDLSAAPDPAREAARLMLHKALASQARLENTSVAIWGQERLETSFPEAMEAMSSGDKDFRGRRYQAAADAYRTADARFQRLEANRPKRLAKVLARGALSLATETAETAAADFQMALVLESGNEVAANGLARARLRPAALTELARGRRLEEGSDIDGARLAYLAALDVDSEFVQARMATERTGAIILDRDFDAAMESAAVALEQGQLKAAGSALRRARALKPDGERLSALEHRLSTARRRIRLARLRQRAVDLVAAERWQEAVDVFDAMLQVDDALTFAIHGKARADKFAKLHREIRYYLSKPERLYSPDPLMRAQALLANARGVKDPGPKLMREQRELEALIESAQVPVGIVFRSDGRTQVTLLRVARMGVFSQQSLELKPGRYVAVGSRSGFRDVRVQFDVKPRSKPMSVTVACEEPI